MTARRERVRCRFCNAHVFIEHLGSDPNDDEIVAVAVQHVAPPCEGFMATLAPRLGTAYYATTDPVLRALVPAVQAGVDLAGVRCLELQRAGRAHEYMALLLTLGQLDRAWSRQDSATVRAALFELERQLTETESKANG